MEEQKKSRLVGKFIQTNNQRHYYEEQWTAEANKTSRTRSLSAHPVADPWGVLGVPWNPSFLAILYYRIRGKVRDVNIFVFFASRSPFAEKHRENVHI